MVILTTKQISDETGKSETIVKKYILRDIGVYNVKTYPHDPDIIVYEIGDCGHAGTIEIILTENQWKCKFHKDSEYDILFNRIKESTDKD